MTNYNQFRNSRRYDPLKSACPDRDNENVCTLWVNYQNGVIVSAGEDEPRGHMAIPIKFKYSEGVPEPELADPRAVMSLRAIEKAIERIRRFREKRLNDLVSK